MVWRSTATGNRVYQQLIFTNRISMGGALRLSISNVTFEPSDIWHWPLVCICTITIALLGFNVKVNIQKSRSKIETRLVGTQCSIEDSFLAFKIKSTTSSAQPTSRIPVHLLAVLSQRCVLLLRSMCFSISSQNRLSSLSEPHQSQHHTDTIPPNTQLLDSPGV